MNIFKIAYKRWYCWAITAFFTVIYIVLLGITKNFSFSWTILSSGNLNASEKAGYVFDSFLSIFSLDEFSFYNVLVILVGVCCSIVLTFVLFMKVIKKKEFMSKSACKINTQTKVTSTLGAVISFFAIGCVGCQTALISPVVALITAGTAAVAVGQAISVFILLIALILSIYSLIKITTQVREEKYDGF
jgi:hypothetical protein